MANHSYRSLLYSVKHALRREVIPTFRGVAVGWEKGSSRKEDLIHLYFYIEGTIDSDLRDDCTSIGAEVIADFSEGSIDEHIIQLDPPAPLPQHPHWVYKRKEASSLDEENLIPVENEDLYLAGLRALLGRISPSVVAVFLDTAHDPIKFHFYTDGVLQNECVEDFKKIIDRFERYSQKHSTFETHVLDKPRKLKTSKKPWCAWLYQRKEPPSISDIYSSLLYGAQHALLGIIEPCFRGVALEWKESFAVIYFYLEGDISHALYQSLLSITQRTSQFSMKDVVEETIRCDYPTLLPKHSHWVFRRYEDLTMEIQDSNDYEGIGLSVGYAVLDKIIPAIRSVGVSIDSFNDLLTLLFCIDGTVDEDITALCECIADSTRTLNPDYEVRTEMYRVDLPNPLPKSPDLHSIFKWKQ